MLWCVFSSLIDLINVPLWYTVQRSSFQSYCTLNWNKQQICSVFFFFLVVSLIRTPEPSLRGFCQRDLFSLGGNGVTKSLPTCDFRSLNNADACTLVFPLLTLSQQGEIQLQLMKWSRGIFEWGQLAMLTDWLTDWLNEWMNTGLPVFVTDWPT